MSPPRGPNVALPAVERPEGSVFAASSSGSDDGSAPPPPPAATASLLGAPSLPFGRRFHMTLNTSSAHSSRLVIVGILAVLLRQPSEPPLLRLALVSEVCLMLLDLAWRRRCRQAPDGGSHARYRDAILPMMALIDVAYSRCLVSRMLLDDFGPAPLGALGTLRHIVTLVVASRVLTNTLIWSQWFRIGWAFPAHVAMVVNLMKTNSLTCQSAALAGSPAAADLTHCIAQVLRLLRFNSLASPPPAELARLQDCCAVLAYLQLSLSLAVPALAMAAHESRLFLGHAAERRRAGLPPERGWHPWLYRRLGDALLGLDWPFAAVLGWVLLGVLGALAEAMALGAVPPAPA